MALPENGEQTARYFVHEPASNDYLDIYIDV